MLRRFRAYWPDDDEWHWLELDEALEPARHIVFRSGVPIVAGDADEHVDVRRRSELAFHVYASHFGGMGYGGPVEAPGDAIPVSKDEFDRTYRRARPYLRPIGDGPLGPGSVVAGAFRANPWPDGRTGALVDLGHDPLHGFVDAIWFFHAEASWPEPGTRAEFTVLDFRPDTLQLRLQPTASPSLDVDWPHPQTW